jgi:hypothetical protein
MCTFPDAIYGQHKTKDEMRLESEGIYNGINDTK